MIEPACHRARARADGSHRSVVRAALVGSVLLVASPVRAGCGPATGSVPTILSELAPLIVATSGGAVQIEPPFGPPQGALDPKLRAFLEGSADFALLTREAAEADLTVFREHHAGRAPFVLPVAAGNWNRFGYVDAVAVIVHRNNPVGSLSLAQLDAVFSTTRWRGHAPVTRWEDVGVALPLGTEPIRVLGGLDWQRQESARALTVRRHVLSVNGQVGSWREVPEGGSEAEVVNRVGRDPAGIGFTGMGHLSDDVRAVPIEQVALTARTARSGSYPLLRTVDLLLDAPDGRIDPRLRRLARSLLRRATQQAIAAQGDLGPLPRRALGRARRRLAALGVSSACKADGG